MWRNDIKYKYMFMFPQTNLARKGLRLCYYKPTFFTMLHSVIFLGGFPFGCHVLRTDIPLLWDIFTPLTKDGFHIDIGLITNSNKNMTYTSIGRFETQLLNVRHQNILAVIVCNYTLICFKYMATINLHSIFYPMNSHSFITSLCHAADDFVVRR